MPKKINFPKMDIFICCWPSELDNYSLDDVPEEIFINLETLVSADIVKQCRICKNFVQPALNFLLVIISQAFIVSSSLKVLCNF